MCGELLVSGGSLLTKLVNSVFSCASVLPGMDGVLLPGVAVFVVSRGGGRLLVGGGGCLLSFFHTP